MFLRVQYVINGKGKKRTAAKENRPFNFDRPKPKRTKNAIKKVGELVNRKILLSQENMANIIGTSARTVRRIIHEDLGLKTVKKPTLHALQERHINSRLINARKLTRKVIRPENYEFLVTLDESWIYLNDCNKGA